MGTRFRGGMTMSVLVGVALTVLSCRAAFGQGFDLSGVQIWNVGHWQTTSLGDFYGPNYELLKLKPIELAGCKNGVFSGYAVVTWSMGPIEGLKATIGDLKGPGDAVIPASQVRVRFAYRASSRTGRTPSTRFNLLLDTPPETITIVNVTKQRSWKPKHVGPIAMMPVWVTVRVPKDAATGVYVGELKVTTDNNSVPPVPVKLHVADWALPDPIDFRIQTVALQSQESVAKHYGVELWSDEHLRLMGESLKLLGELNSRQLAMNLTIDYYGTGGNDETMVRWIKQPDGSYKHDFTPFDRYLDTAAEAIGRPNMLRLNCWGEWTRGHGKSVKEKAHWGGPSKISLLDPESGKLTPMEQPGADTPEFKALWRPVLTNALAKIKARGWLDVTAFGANSYCWGINGHLVDMAHEVWPEGVWAYTAHNGGLGMRVRGTKKGVVMPVRYPEHIWGPGPGAGMKGRGYKLLLKPRVGCIFHTMRNMFWDHSPLWTVRAVTERNVTGGHDGVIGRRAREVIEHLVTDMPTRWEVAKGDLRLSGALFALELPGGRCSAVHRIQVASE